MPFAGYRDFDDCVAKNRDKRNPEAYCASIKARAEAAEPAAFAARPQQLAGLNGRKVRARTLTPEFDRDGEPTDTSPDDVEGYLSVVHVDTLDYWRYSVDGITVDPDTIQLA